MDTRRIQLEVLITRREGMVQANRQRELQGYSAAYDELSFALLVEGMARLIPEPEPGGEAHTELSELRQAVGLASTIVPDMEIDVRDPVGMMQRVVAEVERLKKGLETERQTVERLKTGAKPAGCGCDPEVGSYYEDCPVHGEAQQAEQPDPAPGLREALADYAHEAWCGWMRYLFEKCECLSESTSAGGRMVIPYWAEERWRYQASTPYARLPEDSKDSDRSEADKILALIDAAEARHREEIARARVEGYNEGVEMTAELVRKRGWKQTAEMCRALKEEGSK